MHITYAHKSLIVGDEAGTLITEYAAALARALSADTVTLRAIGADGDDVEAIFVLDSGTVLMAETASTSVAEPDNAEAIAYMQEKTRLLNTPQRATPFNAEELQQERDLDHGPFDDGPAMSTPTP